MDSTGLRLTLGKTEYKFRKLQLTNAEKPVEEAEVIYRKFKTEMGEGKVTDKRWSNDELELLQWVVLNYSWQNKKPMETLVDSTLILEIQRLGVYRQRLHLAQKIRVQVPMDEVAGHKNLQVYVAGVCECSAQTNSPEVRRQRLDSHHPRIQ
eukprot:TRINITY_DN15664_c0_g1_i3.p1 TRINITY_DN15664_c0_g1~~TRINITY_DN15664_c0_g1_i3.p1  ORF type:complete len:152 (+),score=18.53 TRINITY_DN15664_c0_g1_i3:397-852(+)